LGGGGVEHRKSWGRLSDNGRPCEGFPENGRKNRGAQNCEASCSVHLRGGEASSIGKPESRELARWGFRLEVKSSAVQKKTEEGLGRRGHSVPRTPAPR